MKVQAEDRPVVGQIDLTNLLVVFFFAELDADGLVPGHRPSHGFGEYSETSDAAEILKEALALPTEARAALAGSLLDSLDTEVDEDAEAAWATEVNRRVAELDSGAVKTIPWAEVRRRLAAR